MVGTTDVGNVAIADVRPHPLGYQDYIDRSRVSRNIRSDYSIHPLKVAIDKKPEDMTEVVRIVRAGGRVHRQTESKIGPQRVWRGELEHPGLMYSRAIGDRDFTDLGISSEPEISQYTIRSEFDCFLVVGSSGLWEIFEDSECVRFVEKYRGHCQRSGSSLSPASCAHSNIAHLLCEEARIRWLPVLEGEAIALPDVSAVVAEFLKEDEEN